MNSWKLIRKTAFIVTMFLVIVTVFRINTLSSFAQQGDIICYGDVDGNRKIQADDALLVLKHVVKLETIQEEIPALLADIDQNSSIDAEDALQILKTVVKLIPPVPYRQGASEEPPAESEKPAEGKTLVVYFSATGNTKEVAGYIADAVGADQMELTPVNPYSAADLSWTDPDSRVVYEHDNPDAREVTLAETSVPDWDSYDTVFIGYPIWWGIAAWPVNGFVSANDFTGKTVIPFCTSSSSGIGERGILLEELAGTGNWLEGMRFRSNASKEVVQEWVGSLAVR